jgi:hypothetical protein
MTVGQGMYPKEVKAVWEKLRRAIGTGAGQQRCWEDGKDVDDNVCNARRSTGGQGSGIKGSEASFGFGVKNELALVELVQQTKGRGKEEKAAGREKREKDADKTMV